MGKSETDLREAFGDLVVEEAKRVALTSQARIIKPYEGEPVCRVDGEWYAITASGRQHKRARDEIGALGYVPYLPMENVRVGHGRGSFRMSERPMFGAYMFVRCPGTPGVFSQVATARGVGDIVRIEGQAPRPIKDGAIEAIRLYEAKLRGADALARTKTGMVWTFSAGDEVRIKSGPFADFYAKLETAVDHRDRIKAAIHYFGRVSVADLSAFDIEAV